MYLYLDSNGILQNLLNISTKKLTAIFIENIYFLPKPHREIMDRIEITEIDLIFGVIEEGISCVKLVAYMHYFM